MDGTPVDFYRDYLRFHVVSEKRDSGIVYFDNHWVNGGLRNYDMESKKKRDRAANF